MRVPESQFWLMDQTSLQQFRAFAAAGFRATSPTRTVERTPRQSQKRIAVLPIHGVLESRPTPEGQFLGMTNYEQITEQFRSLVADSSITAILLDVCSPGGAAAGCMELAQVIYDARAAKPVIASVSPIAASGAYWLAAAASRVILTPSGDVGSIGVIAEHIDISQSLEQQGVKRTAIRSTLSPFKGEMTDAEPLTAEGRANLQSRADAIHKQFASDLARFRGTTIDHVNAKFGQGRMVDARRALSAGMIDRIASRDETIQLVLQGRIRLAGNAALDTWGGATAADRTARVQALKNSLPDAFLPHNRLRKFFNQ